MRNPIEIIDRNAEAIARSLDIMVYSLEGLYEKAVRESPTTPGLAQFWANASLVSDQSVAMAMNMVAEAARELYASLSDSERVHYDTHTDSANEAEVAYESIGAFFAQAKVSYARRLREIVTARAFNTDTYTADPRIMTRTGRRWNFSEYAYLTVRQLLVDWYNNAKVSYMAASGFKQFTLLTDNPELIDSVYDVADYPQIAADLFHPRTTKLVGEPYVST